MSIFSRKLEVFRRFDVNGSVSGSIFVNFGAAGLSALSSIVFARVLGISDFGLYVYIVSVIGLVGTLATLGLPTLITRETAAWAATGEWKKFNGILRFGLLVPLISASFFGLFLLLGAPFLGKITATPGFHLALALGIGIMVLQCLDLAVAGLLQGMHVVARSLIPQGIVVPLCLVVSAVGARLLHLRVDAVRLLAIQLAAGIVVESYQVASIQWRRPRQSIGHGHEIHAQVWLRNALPFLGNGILFIINTQADTLLLGYFRGSSSAGIYQVGTRAAQLVVLSLGAIATAMQPRLAGLHAAGDHAAIEKIVTHITRIALAIAAVGAVVLLLSGRILIKDLFGPAFLPAVSVLFILVIARLVNASVGSLGPYLAMTGKESLMMKGLVVEACLNITLNIVLIPHWGLDGSAFATGISMAVVNLTQAIYVFRRWGVDTSFLGIRRSAP